MISVSSATSLVLLVSSDLQSFLNPMHAVTLFNNCLANKRKHFLQDLNSNVFVRLGTAFLENGC